MVLAKMNNYEHRSKPIYASYTFQVLTSFWFHPTIKFTAEISEEEITFLDKNVHKGQRCLL